MVLTVTSCSPRGPGSFAPITSANCIRENLAPASGRQDHTTSPSARSAARLATLPASTASRPTFVTTRTPLLSRRDGAENTQFLIFGKRNICARRTDNPNQLESAREIRFCAHAFWRCLRPNARRERRRINQTDLPVGQNGAPHTAIMPLRRFTVNLHAYWRLATPCS
jgi:hypothetical protein